MLKFNEGRACDAILRTIEKRANAQRSNIAFHDEHLDPDRRVELTCNIGSELHAVEHTGIEPFPDFLRMNRESERLFDPIAASASHVIPTDEYVDLHIPVGSLTNHRKKDLKKIQDSLVAFIVETAPTIPSRLPYTRYRGDAPKPVKHCAGKSRRHANNRTELRCRWVKLISHNRREHRDSKRP